MRKATCPSRSHQHAASVCPEHIAYIIHEQPWFMTKCSGLEIVFIGLQGIISIPQQFE